MMNIQMRNIECYEISHSISALWNHRFGICVYRLAKVFGLSVVPAPKFALTDGMLLDASERWAAPRARIRIAHEIGHFLLKQADRDHTCERSAWAIARALLMPSQAVLENVKEFGLNLRPTVEAAGVSWEVAARRYAELGLATVHIWDNGVCAQVWAKGQTDWHPPWAPGAYKRCVAKGADVSIDGRWLHYVPGKAGWIRVVMLSPQHGQSLPTCPARFPRPTHADRQLRASLEVGDGRSEAQVRPLVNLETLQARVGQRVAPPRPEKGHPQKATIAHRPRVPQTVARCELKGGSG